MTGNGGRFDRSNQSDASQLRNAAWRLADVRNQYSYLNHHSDLYRYLSQWSDLEMYLNAGYSSPGQIPAHTNTHLRLIDRVAAGLLALRSFATCSADRRLLDIASGRGGPAIHAHRKYGLDVLGVDITPYNVLRADRNSRQKDAWPHVRFVVGDALELPVADASFSLAWSIESPAHFPDKPAFLREVARVLKPGGLLAFTDLLVVNRVAMASATNRRIYEEFLRAWDVPYLETNESYQLAITKADFELFRTEIVTKNVLGPFKQLCRVFLPLFQIPPLYWAYESYIRFRTEAHLGNVYEHVMKSYRALRLDMIDYGLFWAIRQ